MARKSSVNFKKSSACFEHNDRTEKREPKHLLPEEFRQKNECDRSAVKAKLLLLKMVEDAKKEYLARTGQKCQAKILSVEAVINLEQHHTLEDVEKINKHLETAHGFRAVQSSIHRDEGHINDDGKPEYNYHAHVVYCNLDKEGKTIIKGLEKEDFRELQTFASEALKMTRGQDAEITKAKHKTPQEYRHGKVVEQNKELKKEGKTLKEELKSLKDEKARERVELLENNALRADYAKMEAKYKAIEAEIREKFEIEKRTATELAKEVGILPPSDIKTYTAKSLLPLIKKEYDGKISDLEAENIAIKSTETALKDRINDLEWKLSSLPTKAEFEALQSNLETAETRIGQLDGMIEEGATTHELHELYKNNPYQRRTSAYQTAKTRASEAYRIRKNEHKAPQGVGRSPLRP
jgi:hypothetical protein